MAFSPNGNNGWADILAPTLTTLEWIELWCLKDWDLRDKHYSCSQCYCHSYLIIAGVLKPISIEWHKYLNVLNIHVMIARDDVRVCFKLDNDFNFVNTRQTIQKDDCWFQISHYISHTTLVAFSYLKSTWSSDDTGQQGGILHTLWPTGTFIPPRGKEKFILRSRVFSPSIEKLGFQSECFLIFTKNVLNRQGKVIWTIRILLWFWFTRSSI